jgi:hypothetical protein
VAINFPTSLDNFTNPSSGNTLDSPSHSLQHSDINDAVEALEAKLGIGASPAGSASAGQVLTISAAGTSTWTGQGLTQLVPTSVSVTGVGASGSVDSNGAITFSTATALSINGIFNANYDNYVIIGNKTTCSSNGTDIKVNFRVSATDNSNAQYSYGRSFTDYSAIGFGTGGGSSTGTATFGLIAHLGTSQSGFSATIFNPFLSAPTSLIGNSIALSTYGYTTAQYSTQKENISFDGMTLTSTTGTIAGTIRIYGLRN